MPLPQPNPTLEELPQPKPVPNGRSAGSASLLLHLGEAWYEPAPAVFEALRSLDPRRYPDSLCQELRAELASYVGHGVQPNQILVGNGSDGLIDLLVRCYANATQPVIAPGPTFFAYAHAARLQGVSVLNTGRSAQRTGFVLDPLTLPSGPGVLFLANPNNPTGELLPTGVVEQIASTFAGLVVVDECYFEFAQETALSILQRFQNAVILRSLSKSFALAGLRVGYLIAHPTIVSALERADQTFTVNAAAQAAGVAALQALDYYSPLFKRTAVLREELANEFRTLGLHPFPSAANILLVEYGERTATNLAAVLREKGIYVADYHGRGEVSCAFRTAVGSPEDNRRLLEALHHILAAN